LSPALSVPDEKFASTEPQSPFSGVAESSSTMLLVCKRWLRVTYSLLYRTVVIRSPGQAQALADALHSNSALGKHIKKLRLEGGYGAATRKILTLAPNITDLYLTLYIWSDDSVSGLCRSLPTINPSRIILHDNWYQAKFNANARLLTLKLCECILLWSNLVPNLMSFITPLLSRFFFPPTGQFPLSILCLYA
jgi:cellulose synthase/poly-beta-1,6-N-acetylglucosamine synthase-like glycosyltransferase